MTNDMQENYLLSVIKQFEYYKSVGKKTIAQLSDDELFWQYHSESNSMAIMVNHLWGNMMSRWTDFLKSDGEKEWRNRDQEFEDTIKSRTELLQKWEEGWSCLFKALSTINSSNFNQQILIRNQNHSIVEAVNRQMMHYAYHVGQMVFLGKMIKGDQWQSLSIPKGQSKSFNAKKFSKGQHDGHFTDDIK